ncbi:hypothetical protein [Streptomyces sp. NBC_00299]|uniref:hypothetical protein n=1 Tax=Streptomyces sp. NBC_00299 TaxID=2975705 RepID=UPI002E28D883|nr:hypothetical protein [Streptomyces sp. NBC_00299]
MTAENVQAGQDITLVIGSTEVDSIQTVGEVTLGDEVAKIGEGSMVVDALGGVTSDVVQPGQITLVVAEGQGQVLASQLGEESAADGEAGQDITLAIKDADGAVRQFTLRSAWASSWTASDLSAGSSGSTIETVLIEFDDVEFE